MVLVGCQNETTESNSSASQKTEQTVQEEAVVEEVKVICSSTHDDECLHK